MLYAGSERVGCFLETLARFRKAPNANEIVRTLSEITNADDDYIPPGVVPGSWLARRTMGQAVIQPGSRFADVYSSLWLSSLRERLEPEAVKMGLLKSDENSFDLSTLLTNNRKLTQRAATLIYHQSFDGVYYHSRHGAELENWALFEKLENDFGIVQQASSVALSYEDPDLKEALSLFRLELAPLR